MPPRAYLKLLALSIAGIVVASALTFAALVVRLAIVDPFGGPQHPTDGALLAQFAAQRPALEELVGMLGEDAGIERLAADFTRPDPLAAAPGRVADYRARLAAAGIAHGLARHGDTATFIVSTRGLAISGSAKAFVHAPQGADDATVVNGDLDAAAAALADKNVLLQRPIGEGWWLQLDMR
jgi:hypothetical protein